MARKEIKISDNILLAYSKDVQELAKFANGLIKARGEGGITVEKADSGWLFSVDIDPDSIEVLDGLEERTVVVQKEDNEPQEWIGLFKDA